MRVQLDGQSLRLRLEEGEFQRLLNGHIIENRTHFPDGGQIVQQICLADALSWECVDDIWSVQLPGAEVRAYGGRLPTREGLDFNLDTSAGALRIRFDVDVRDSVRQRRASKSRHDGT